MSKPTHALERTSPKGGPFLGKCWKCGATDLPASAIMDECPNTRGTDFDEDLRIAVEGCDQ